jgi:hypothetical protein
MESRSYGAYSFITIVYFVFFALLASLIRRAKGTKKEVAGADILLLGLATYRLSRLISYDRVTQYLRIPFVEPGKGAEQVEGTSEEPKGEGLQYAVGQLLTCAYCSSVWAGTFNSALYLLSPRVGRLFLLSMASSGLSEILDPIFLLLSYLSGYINKIEQTKQEEMKQGEIFKPGG